MKMDIKKHLIMNEWSKILISCEDKIEKPWLLIAFKTNLLPILQSLITVYQFNRLIIEFKCVVFIDENNLNSRIFTSETGDDESRKEFGLSTKKNLVYPYPIYSHSTYDSYNLPPNTNYCFLIMYELNINWKVMKFAMCGKQTFRCQRSSLWKMIITKR